MNQTKRSETSRQQILVSALNLFSRYGYGGTTVQDIAENAGVSKGNIYHHFSNKEAIFRLLLERYFTVLSQPEFAFSRALSTGTFPENLEALARVVRDIVRNHRQSALVYIDVVEFNAAHVRPFYAEMGTRFAAFLKRNGMEASLQARLTDGLSPTSAVILATRIFFNYFSIELLFGVKNQFGKETDEVIGEIAQVLRHGMLRKDLPAQAPRSN